MGTTADKLQYLINAKNSISAAIETKGGTVPQELSGYGPAIADLPSGGSDIAPRIIDRTVTELKASDFGNATAIGVYAFYNCSALSSVTFPNTISSFGNYSFGNCTKLSSLTFPDSVTQIENYAFYNSWSLSTFDFGDTRSTIPTLAGSYVFWGTNSNYKIYVPYEIIDSWCSAAQWSNVSAHIVPNVPWSETDTVVLSGTATGSIAKWYGTITGTASQGDVPLTAQTTGTELMIGPTVTELGQNFLDPTNTFTDITFRETSTLTAISPYGLVVPNAQSITFPSSITNISANAFNGCTSCKEYDFSNFSSIPTLEDVNAFASIAAANGKIKVSESLYDSWIVAPVWSDLAQYIGWRFFDYYVDGTNGSDTNDGSQDHPFATIQKAINVSVAGNSIGVKAGTYAPITSGNKDITIVGMDGISNTIIDGGGTSRCATLVTSSNRDPQPGQDVLTKLVGFTLQNGKRTGRETTTGGGNGGGVSGGTLYKCFIKNCTVSEYGSGGGCAGTNAYSCIFYGCTANPNCPAAICSNIVNCTLAYNGQTLGTGMGIVGVGSVRNCLIAYNNRVRTIWSSTTVSNNYTSTSNSVDSSIFVNPTSDWHLNANSSYVTNNIKNKGSNTYAYGDEDFYNGVRIVNGTIDIGACEVQAS